MSKHVKKLLECGNGTSESFRALRKTGTDGWGPASKVSVKIDEVEKKTEERQRDS